MYDTTNFNIVDSLLVSFIAIVMVFMILVLIILVSALFSEGIHRYEAATNINPKPENAILASDEDAVVAALVATIDFHKETGKDAKLNSIKRID